MRANYGHKYVLSWLLSMSLQVEVQMEEEMLRCLTVQCLTLDCNWTKELLKGIVTSLYCTRLK
jgi:hypothetical protein